MILHHGQVERDPTDLITLPATDATAFGKLWQEHHRVVLGVAYRILHDRQAAEDVAQETFLRAFKGRDDLHDEATIRWWLIRVATNLALNRVTRVHESPTDLPDSDDAHDLEGEVEGHVKCEAVRNAITALPDVLRLPLVLFEYSGCSCQQIAEQLGLTPATVRVRLFRARRALALDLSAWA